MSIAPVKCCIEVKPSAERTFELFAEHTGSWWPRGRTAGGKTARRSDHRAEAGRTLV